jgi:hypothetical protein
MSDGASELWKGARHNRPICAHFPAGFKMVFGGVPMHFYCMKTVKIARGIGIFCFHRQLRQARFERPGRRWLQPPLAR